MRMDGWEASVREAREIWVRLDAQRQTMEARGDELAAAVAKAKRRLEMQPKVADFLEKIQGRINQRAVGVYEELLTAIVADVLPGERKIELELGMERGLPSLDISIRKDGNLESIMEGSGGSVTNLVSAGLRMIALSRSGHRQFIALDEPDCWIKPERIPRFASVIGQIANDIGIQVLLVSHHDQSFFEGMSTMVRLLGGDGGVRCDIEGGERGVWGDEFSKGIRWIRLQDFMSHSDTTIPMFPGVTCITGDNDIGKSAILAAMRALFDGSSSDSFISHGKKSFRVSVGFEAGMSVVLEHRESKSPKRRWELWCGDEMLRDGSPKSGIPDWLREFSPMERVEGLDIHFSNQKSPVFLLNETSGAKRASILSVGRESGHLVEIQGKAKEDVLLAQTVAREGEREMSRISAGLGCLGETSPFLELLDRKGSEGARLCQAERALETAKSNLLRAREVSLRIALLSEAMASLSVVTPAKPTMVGASERVTLERCRRLSKALSGCSDVPSVVEPSDGRPHGLSAARVLLARASRISEVGTSAVFPDVQQRDFSGVGRAKWGMLDRALGLGEELRRMGKAMAEMDSRREGVRREAEALLVDNPACPTCGKAVSVDEVIGGGHD